MTPEPTVASRDEWRQARLELLAGEKALTRQRDELSRQRCALLWMRVEADYVFDAVDGSISGRAVRRSQSATAPTRGACDASLTSSTNAPCAARFVPRTVRVAYRRLPVSGSVPR